MEIVYLGHASFLLRYKSVRVVCDPFGKEVGFSLMKVKADIVTVSHEHGDHNQLSGVEGEPIVVRGPGEYEIKEVSIIGIQTFHDDKEGSLRGKNTIYTIDIADLRLGHLGDLGHKLEEEHLSLMDGVDILMIPVGGGYSLDPGMAMEVIKQIGPSVVIPMHFKTREHNKKIFGKLARVEEFIKESGMEARREKKLMVKKLDLPEEMEIVVLERKS
jgi:L-ascorbate metabolism protein UlaG (beta-lactamase superfamily)